MGSFVLKRFLKGLLVVWFIWSLVFVLVRATGDPVAWMLPDGATLAEEEALREALHLNDPILKQYTASLKDLFRGEWGNSYYYKRPVVDLYLERIGPTVQLAVPVLVIADILGLILGIVAACKRDSALDRVTMSFTVVGSSMPNFVLGILMIFLFAVRLRWLPTGSTGTWKHFVMPGLAMMVGPMASVARLTRSALLDNLTREYLDGARMKGLSNMNVLFKHAVRNSLIPVVTSIGMQLSTIIGGAVTVEAVFGWPGVGTLISTAAQQRDFPVIQFGVTVIASAVTLATILIDISYGLLDPRIRANYK